MANIKMSLEVIIMQMIDKMEEGGMDCSYTGKNYDIAIDEAIEKILILTKNK